MYRQVTEILRPGTNNLEIHSCVCKITSFTEGQQLTGNAY
jgi:hypothetical protein